jgi:serine/threonine protein phosphatase PrpC
MKCFAYSEAGHNHINEDAIAVQVHPLDANALLCVLADGQGGQFGGAAASQTAVARCLELAGRYTPQQLLDPASWYEIVSGVDSAVLEQDEAGFTTFIGLCVANGNVCGVSCGDSMALLVRANGYTDLTENQRKNPPVGSGAAFAVAFTANISNKPNATLLLLSDGVWRYVGKDKIAQQCRERQGRELILSLRQLQTQQNGDTLPDDFSVILVQIPAY